MEVEKDFYKIVKRRNNEEEFSRICSEQVVHVAVSEVDLKASTCKLQEVKCVFLFGSLASQEVWLSILAEPAEMSRTAWDMYVRAGVGVRVCTSTGGRGPDAQAFITAQREPPE